MYGKATKEGKESEEVPQDGQVPQGEEVEARSEAPKGCSQKEATLSFSPFKKKAVPTISGRFLYGLNPKPGLCRHKPCIHPDHPIFPVISGHPLDVPLPHAEDGFGHAGVGNRPKGGF